MKKRKTIVLISVWFLLSWSRSVADTNITFRVMDKELSTPLVDARIELEMSGLSEDQAVENGSTDREGYFRSSSTLESGEAAMITVRKPGYVPWRFSYREDGGRQFIGRGEEVAVPACRPIGGVVVDENGTPIPEVKVALSIPQSLAGPRIPASDLAATASLSGEWKSDAVPADVRYIRVEVQHPDFKMLGGKPEDLSVEALQALKSVVRMKGLCRLKGIVVDPAGTPIAGAKVIVGGEWGVRTWDDNPSVETQSTGSFQLDLLNVGKRMLVAEADSWAPATLMLDIRKGMEPVEIRLKAPSTISLRITDTEEKPIANAAVSVWEWENYTHPGWEFRSDAEGRVVWTTAPEGVVSINVSKPGYIRRRHIPVGAGPEEHVIKLDPEPRPTGIATDATKGTEGPLQRAVAMPLPGGNLKNLAKAVPDPGEPNEKRRLTGSMKAIPLNREAGGAFALVIRLRLLDGHHVYPMGDPDENPAATTLKLDLPEGFEPKGDWVASDAVKKAGTPVYRDEVVFGRAIQLPKGAVAVGKTLECRIGYQICNDSVCWPPAELPLETILEIQEDK